MSEGNRHTKEIETPTKDYEFEKLLPASIKPIRPLANVDN